MAVLAAGGGPELHLRQVHGEVVGEPAVPGPEALRLRRLGVPHQPGAVAERLEVHDLVVPDPELLPDGEVQVLGREQVEDVPDPVAGAGAGLAEGVAGRLAGDLPAAGAALSDAAFHSANGCRRSSDSAVLSRSLPTMSPSKCRFRL